MKTNSQFVSSWFLTVVSRSTRVTDSRWSVPWAAATSLRRRTSTLSAAWMRATRYSYIESSSRAARTTMTTRLATLAKLSTACPAELAAPTT